MKFRYTVGFEIEDFNSDDVDNFDYLQEKLLGKSYGVWQDGSGPDETASLPYPLFSSEIPLPLLIAISAIDFSDHYNFVDYEDCDYYNDDEDCEDDVRTAGLHHHIRIVDVDDVNIYEDLRYYLATHIPILQFLFARYGYVVGHNIIKPDFTSKRRDWADKPPLSRPCYWCRDYHAVTPNPGERGEPSKPNTLEIRICESSPLACTTAIAVLVTGWENNIIMNAYNLYYAPVPLGLVLRYLEEILQNMPNTWEKLVVEKVYNNISEGKKFMPYTIESVLDIPVFEEAYSKIKPFLDY